MLRFSASTVTSRSSTESNDDNCEVILPPWDAKDRLTPWKCPLYASPRGYVTSAITRYSAVISRTRGYLRRSPPLAAGCEPPIPPGRARVALARRGAGLAPSLTL